MVRNLWHLNELFLFDDYDYDDDDDDDDDERPDENGDYRSHSLLLFILKS